MYMKVKDSSSRRKVEDCSAAATQEKWEDKENEEVLTWAWKDILDHFLLSSAMS